MTAMIPPTGLGGAERYHGVQLTVHLLRKSLVSKDIK